MNGSWLFLYGPPGSGKTRVGETLARRLDLPSVDLDSVVEREAGRTVAEIFASSGEDDFRERERRALQRVLEGEGGVVSLGGGALLLAENRRRAEGSGPVVVLDASEEILERRLAGGSPVRPLLAGGPDRLRALLGARREHYGSFALRADAAPDDPEQVARAVEAVAGMFRVSGMATPYPVLVRRGSLPSVGAHLRRAACGGPVAVVADDHTGPLFGDGVERALRDAGYDSVRVDVPAGEAGKTPETVRRLWERFLDGGLERGSTVLAVGGGVVSDLAGFAAASYLRGIDWAVIPTTLLAMVDAAVGGKTGANLPRGKNLVGAFHPPRFVLSDPDSLASLPPEELRQGLAEVVKHGVIDDPGLFERCEAGLNAVEGDLERIVRRGVAVKIRVVEDDPYETARRAALNLGHTVGHAVERVSRYTVRHGAGVAIGLVAEARVAEAMGGVECAGLSERIAAVVRGLGLPDSVPAEIATESLLEAMQVDKKRSGARVRFALPARIGDVRTGIEVDPDLLRDVLLP